jgi:hypothetical protein
MISATAAPRKPRRCVEARNYDAEGTMPVAYSGSFPFNSVGPGNAAHANPTRGKWGAKNL